MATQTETPKPTPRVTMTLSVGPTNTSTYRRLLDILFAPEEPTNYPNGLHTEAA